MRKFALLIILTAVAVIAGLGLPSQLRTAAFNLGMLSEEIAISGTGSMYPTFPKSTGVSDEDASRQTVATPRMKKYPAGLKIFGQSFFSYKLGRGDIVEFENEMTRKITRDKYREATGFVKRIVALPGDEIELRDGYVYLSGEKAEEPYTAKPRSTYGGAFLSDCNTVKVPANYIFVMGDNRKASLDSRHDLGFVAINDVHHVLPLSEQDKYRNNWRDISADGEYAHSPTLNESDFVEALNEVRQSKKLKALANDGKLVHSARIRGLSILKTDDFSTEATRSGVDLSRSIRESDYKNIIFGELFTRGFYESEELMENFREFPDSSEILYSTEYQDIGAAAVIDEINGCPTQVIVIHLGGYQDPEYDPDDVASWKKLVENLTSIIPSWENLRTAENVNREKLERLLDLLAQRLSNAGKIYSRLSQNQWLSADEEKFVQADKELHTEAENIINELNRQ
ncbi:MAG: signal peptidase I TraF, signal peptidase I [Candidatus Gottesmanbacteria bacterium GW2011_GWA2_43_14]|uniref:Signal peptidase I n=1 Tax=Candidatus Gottesmanbacteria bacterium GW2011_GWA2_43_14 TaxID=1618443 RepID=A0A0G1FUQ5_9BACT|nr:MAG: signal peptidase I TraF, signal peptidase I [Candidatus Gottesmanbacteria bacterium GW2011_GWA2_43_14]